MWSCVCVRAEAKAGLTANSGANWLTYGTVRTTNTEDGSISVEFESTSHSSKVHRFTRSPSLLLAMLKTFSGYFAFSSALMLGYSCIIFVNPFLLK